MKSPEQWALRYVILLWLYIICIIPFDLAQFDDPSQSGHTARSLQDLAKRYLNSAGLEREGAALLLSRLYIRYATWYRFLKDAYLNRKDTGTGFHDFVLWTCDLLKDSNDVMMVRYSHTSNLLGTHADVFCRKSESCKRYARLSSQVLQHKFNPKSLHWCQLLATRKRIQ